MDIVLSLSLPVYGVMTHETLLSVWLSMTLVSNTPTKLMPTISLLLLPAATIKSVLTGRAPGIATFPLNGITLLVPVMFPCLDTLPGLYNDSNVPLHHIPNTPHMVLSKLLSQNHTSLLFF
jgi:hypothetical protein